jgi:hypothetical protein
MVIIAAANKLKVNFFMLFAFSDVKYLLLTFTALVSQEIQTGK